MNATQRCRWVGIKYLGLGALLGASLMSSGCVGDQGPESGGLESSVAELRASKPAPDRGRPQPRRGLAPRFRGHNPHPGSGHVCHGDGGMTGAGGRGGVGGMTGAGGAPPPPPPMACLGTRPPTPLITAFSDAIGSDPITFGTAPNLTGGTFSYAGAGLTAPALSLTPSGAGTGLHVVTSPGATTDANNNFFGFGLFFNSCVDARAYTGVQFTISGNLGNCGIAFATNFSETVSPADDPRGTCTLPVCFPGSLPVTTTGTIVVPFASVSGGSPPVIDPASIVGVQWQMGQALGAACTADFVITNVSFTTAVSPPPPPPPPPLCPVVVPSTPALTGTLATVAAPGSLYTFAAPGLVGPVATPLFGTDASWQGLDVTLNPGATTDPANAYLGFGVPLFGCVDARAFSGIRFTITGDLGTCPLQLGLVTREDNSVMFGGACTDSLCLAPTSGVLTTGVNVVPFAALTGGAPQLTVDPAALNDVQWQLNVPTDGVTPACSAHFAITDIAFVP